MKRLVAIAVLGLALTACGSSSPAPQTHGGPGRVERIPPSPVAFRFTKASNRAFARRDARTLLRIVVVPRGARQVAAVPKSAPSWFRNELSHDISGAAVVHRTWVIRQPLKDVVRFIRAHEKRQPRAKYGYPSPTERIGSRPHDSFLFDPIPGRSSSRWLNVAELALPSGATVVTAQAGDAWIKPPPHSAELPRSVKTIDITSRYVGRRPVVRLHVRDHYDVGSIVSWMNGLGVSPNYICFGPFFSGPTITLTFRNAAGTPVARAAEGGRTGGPCGSLSLRVRGRTAPPLMVGDLLRRIGRLLHADLAPPLQRAVAICLRGRGWHVRTSGRELVARTKGRATTLTFRATGKVTRTGPRHTAIARCLRISPYFSHFG